MALSSHLTKRGNEFNKPGRGLSSGRELNQLFRLINNIRSSDESLLSVTTSAGGILLTPKTGTSTIGTPFGGTISDDQKSIIIGKDRALPTYKYVDRLIFGITRYTKTASETILLTPANEVISPFVEVGYKVIEQPGNPGTLLIELKQGGGVQKEDEMYLPLGRAEFLNGLIIGWTQWQVGEFYFAARLF